MSNLKFIAALSAALFLAGCSQPATNKEGSAQPQASKPQSDAAQPAVPAQRASGEVEIAPSQPSQGESVKITFRLKDSSGNPMPDAAVKAHFVMSMGGMDMREPVDLKWNGTEYVGSHKPSMAGEWEVNVEARKNGQLLLSMPSTIEVKARKK